MRPRDWTAVTPQHPVTCGQHEQQPFCGESLVVPASLAGGARVRAGFPLGTAARWVRRSRYGLIIFFLSRIALGRKYWRWSFTLVVFFFPREEGFESERAGSGRKLVRVRNARFEIWLLLAKPGRAGGRASGALSSTAEMGRVVSSAVRVVRKRTTIGGAGRQFPPRARADVTPSSVASVSSLARFLRIPKALAARGH